MRTEELAIRLLERLKAKGLTLATAESCTGGWIGAALTAIPGSSAAYVGGIISYTNGVKEKLLGVPHEILETKGAVSRETACAMALGAQNALGSDLAVSVTGLAGPDSDGSGKPVGLVYVGCAVGETVVSEEHVFPGNRQAVREAAVCAALELALKQN